MSRFVLISPDALFERRLQLALGATQFGELQRLEFDPFPTQPAQVLGAVTSAAPEVIVLGPGVPFHDALDLAARFEQQRPDLVVLLVADPGVDLWSRALRAGVRDVLAPDADGAEIREVLERASQTAGARRRAVAGPEGRDAAKGRVVTVLSPKGGVGKTTMATNVAIDLADRDPDGVVLIDLDLQFGDVASSLQIEPEHTISHTTSVLASGDAMVLKTFLHAHSDGLYVLTAPRTPAEADHITAEHTGQLIELLSSQFATVVIDTPAGLSEHALAALERSTDLVLPVSMDVPSIRALRRELTVLDELGFTSATRHLVCNFVDRRSGLTIDDAEKTLDLGATATIARSRAVMVSTNAGVPILRERPRHRCSKEVRRLTTSITGVPHKRGKHAKDAR